MRARAPRVVCWWYVGQRLSTSIPSSRTHTLSLQWSFSSSRVTGLCAVLQLLQGTPKSQQCEPSVGLPVYYSTRYKCTKSISDNTESSSSSFMDDDDGAILDGWVSGSTHWSSCIWVLRVERAWSSGGEVRMTAPRLMSCRSASHKSRCTSGGTKNSNTLCITTTSADETNSGNWRMSPVKTSTLV